MRTRVGAGAVDGLGGRLYDAFRRCVCNPEPAAQVRPKARVRLMERVRAQRVCVCGSAKSVGLSVCRDCYRDLPPALRQALWAKSEANFRRGYAQIKRFLERSRAACSAGVPTRDSRLFQDAGGDTRATAEKSNPRRASE